jgi:hypothetical protein
MAIPVAEKVLITGGVLNLAYGVLLGYAITVIRLKGAPATPRYMMAAHVGAVTPVVMVGSAGRPAGSGTSVTASYQLGWIPW